MLPAILGSAARGGRLTMGFDNFWGLAAQQPSRVAAIGPDESTVTAGDLLAGTNQLVHGLRALGLKRGDVIAAVLPNCVEALELYLAIQQAGWYLVPINFHLVGAEIAYILSDCEAAAFVAHAQFAGACIQA